MKLNVELGSRQGSTHSVPDLRKDINVLMDVLKEHEVYTVKLGMRLNANDTPVPDIISAGLSALSHGTTTNNHPLAEFNAQYSCFRERRNMTPVSALVDNHQPSHSNPVKHSGIQVAPSPMNVNSDGTSKEPREEDTDASEAGLEDDDQVPVSDLDELEVESPTLTRLEEDDVALDMDELDLGIEFEEEDGLDSDRDEDDDDFKF
jgi:hypothetical protein